MAAIMSVSTRSHYRLAEEREFHKYIPHEYSSSRYAPFDRASGEGFTPHASPDRALTSYAQLAAHRLSADRAFISLFDSTHQYVLAEATPTLSLTGGLTETASERLILGCCILPKDRGLCHCVETTARRGSQDGHQRAPEDDDGSRVALDVTQDERVDVTKLQAGLSEIRFFVSAPIITPRGFTIGALSVMDSQPRSSAPDEHAHQFLRDMAATVMEHLALKEATVKSRRAERMIVGLGSFVEGRSTLRNSWSEAEAQHLASETSGEATEGQLNIEQQDLQEIARETGQTTLAIRESSRRITSGPETDSPGPDSCESDPDQGAEGDQVEEFHRIPGAEFSHDKNTSRAVLTDRGLKEDNLPSSIRNVFSRAANILRESIEAEGVMFLDANSQRFGNLVDSTKRRVSGSGYKDPRSSSEDSTGSDVSSHRSISDTEQLSDSDSPRVSECLGFSSSAVSSINDETKAGQQVTVPEPLFTSLIDRYPRGKIFTYNSNGSASEDTDGRSQKSSGLDSDIARSPDTRRSSRKRSRRSSYQRYAGDLIKIFAGARTILVLPIADPDRDKWFAGTFIWTNDPHRVFTLENELAYTSAFSNSIMAEIRRLDVEVAERAKTNLVSSITHELRNPLHGILGTADILSDTAMNALQHGMVHTVESCGRTLLDTINSLLDLTFIDQYRKGDTSQRFRDEKGRPHHGTRPLGENPSVSHVELDAVLEEVTDCVFAGYCFYNHPQAPPPALTESSSRSAGQARPAEPVGPQASQVTVIFDIDPSPEWNFITHAGAWRRILMNIFGNALKYTAAGYIHIGLKTSYGSGTNSKGSHGKHHKGFNITLTVKDTGKGIGPKFLQNDLFSPFKQESPLASGSGLGLSIVRQAVSLLGGSIEVDSTVGQGTQISIHAPLNKSTTVSDTSSPQFFSSLRTHTEGRTIGFLGFGQSLRSQRDTALYSCLERMCHDWFGLKVANVSPAEDKNLSCDFYLAIQTELDCEDVDGRNLFGLAHRFRTPDAHTIPVIVICQSPEEAHRMFIASKSRDLTESFEFVSQPCGPRKIARAIKMCTKRQRDHDEGRRSSEAPTHWVEVPGSSQLPLDIEAVDAPQDRMRISKRPTTDTMGNQEDRDSSQTQKQGQQDPNRGGKDTSSKGPPKPNGETPDGGTQESIPRRSVLLVDDNHVNLQLLCAYARKGGFNYHTATNGAEAVDVYKAHPGDIQAVVIDISMPVMDGFQASREIRKIEKEYRASISEAEKQARPSTIIAALSGLDSAGAQKEALGSGINTFLVKPVKRKELEAVLRCEI